MNNPVPSSPRRLAVWLVLLAAAGTFALTMGVRQTMDTRSSVSVL